MMTKTEESKYWHKAERHQFQDELRRLKTRQGRFDAAMLHLDHPLPGTDLYLDPSDRGESAAAMYDSVEVVPLWLRLWRRKRLDLKPKRRAVLDALAVDWRTVNAARIAGENRKFVQRSKKIFKTHFKQCHTAWKRDFGRT